MQKKFRGARTRVTYGNVVATLALFIALGGVSWAATSLPKNSVSSKAIKKNAVTSAKIKKNAVNSSKVKNKSLTGADVKGKSLTGAQINESTLGTVPSAASAGTADNVVAVYKKAPASAGSGSYDASRAASPKVELFSHGQISVYGKCFTYNNSQYVETYAASSANWASLYGYSITDYPYQFGPGTDEEDRQIDNNSTGNDSYSVTYGEGARILGPDGKGAIVDTQTWLMKGTSSGAPSHIGSNECSWQVGGVKIG